MILTDQVEIINNCLRKTYDKKNEDDSKVKSDVEMRNVYSNDEKFLFRITLDEFRCDKIIVVRDDIKRKKYSPHHILYGIFCGDRKFEKILKILEYDNPGIVNINSIGRIVTPNIDKGIWYFENDLVSTNIQVTTFIEMSLSDMRDILRSIPNPDVCLSPSVYNVNNPKSFLKIVNETKNLRIFDFIPYIRKHTINNQVVKSQFVYKLAEKINLIFVTRTK